MHDQGEACVPAGVLIQDSAGETGLGLVWVYLSGMTPPSTKEALERVNGGGGVAVRPAKPGRPTTATMAAPKPRAGYFPSHDAIFEFPNGRTA